MCGGEGYGREGPPRDEQVLEEHLLPPLVDQVHAVQTLLPGDLPTLLRPPQVHSVNLLSKFWPAAQSVVAI